MRILAVNNKFNKTNSEKGILNFSYIRLQKQHSSLMYWLKICKAWIRSQLRWACYEFQCFEDNYSLTISTQGCMEVHSGQKCNLIATCIPLDRIRVPLDRTFLPFDRTSIPFNRTFIPLDRTFLPLDRTSIPFDRTSIVLSLAIWHWFIPRWYFTFIRTSVETAFHRIVTIVRPVSYTHLTLPTNREV